MRLGVFGLMAFALVAGCSAQGATTTGAVVQVKDAWIRTPPPGAPTAAAYATLTNRGIASDRLTGAYTNVAASVGLHETTTQGGVMRMRPLTGGLAVSGSGTVK